MIISGLVIRVDPPGEVDAIAHDLRLIESFTVGEPTRDRLPVVVEAPSPDLMRDLHNWLLRLPAVVTVDVAFVSYEAQPVGEYAVC